MWNPSLESGLQALKAGFKALEAASLASLCQEVRVHGVRAADVSLAELEELAQRKHAPLRIAATISTSGL